MDKRNLLSELKAIEKISIEYELALNEIEIAKKELKKAEAYTPSRLKKFDKQNKSKFIIQHIGKQPKSLGKWNPLRLSKKVRESVLEEKKQYFEKKIKSEELYFKVNEKKRMELKQQDITDKTSRVSQAKINLNRCKEKLASIKPNWENITLLSERLRNSDTIKQMIIFVEDGRADTIKEVINLYFEETRKNEDAKLAEAHRKKIEAEIEKQNLSIQQMIEKLDSISMDVDDAVRISRESMQTAEEALQKANEAFQNSSSF